MWGGKTVTDACPRILASATDVAVITALPVVALQVERSTPVAEMVATVVSLDVQRTASETPGSASTIARNGFSQSERPRTTPGGDTTIERTLGASGKSSRVTLRMSLG